MFVTTKLWMSDYGYERTLLAFDTRLRNLGFDYLDLYLLEDPTIAKLAGKYGKTPAQVALRWHIGHGLSVTPKSVRPERIAENIGIFDFTLSADESRRSMLWMRERGRSRSRPGQLTDVSINN